MNIMDFEIFYEEDTKLAEAEAFDRGCRSDVIVTIGEKKYKIYITTMVRLHQDFDSEQKSCGYYMAEPNTLLVNEVTKKEIEYVVTKMYECKYFEMLDNNGFFDYSRLFP